MAVAIINYLNFEFHLMSNGSIDLHWATGASTTINTDSLWASFSTSAAFTGHSQYSTYSGETKIQRVYGGTGNDIITKTRGGDVFGMGGNDTINAYSVGVSTSQQHLWAGEGADTVNLNFSNIGTLSNSTSMSNGHHLRGDNDGSTSQSADIFNFTGLTTLTTGRTVVGRIEDFDASRDTVQINGATINLTALPSNAKIVVHQGDHNDAGAAPIQWLVIRSPAGGYLVYALEGARVDMQGDSLATEAAERLQERHFIYGATATEIVAQSIAQPNVRYVNPQNVVPLGAVAQGGVTINDYDVNASAVTAAIVGGVNGDLIAGGLNNDVVQGGTGNDQIWGGSGHDLLNGDDGNDTISGGTGNDTMGGGAGDDTFVYTAGSAMIYGGAGGGDTFTFNGSDAFAVSIGGQTNTWGIHLSGIERLIGGTGADTLTGHAGANVLTGNNGNDILNGLEGEDSLIGGNGDDKIYGGAGFDTLVGGAGNDTLEGGANADLLSGGAGSDSFQFLSAADGGDTISDFGAVAVSNDDRFMISAAGFGGGLVAGALSATRFFVQTANSNAAGDASDRFIYNSVAHTLWFDADGNGSAAAPVLIATLQSTAPVLTAADIWVF